MKNLNTTTIFMIIAGFYNIGGILIFSRFFTSNALTLLDPETFSSLGMISIMLWGCAYLSVCRIISQVRILLFVFFIEKMIYTFLWTRWLLLQHARLIEAPWMTRFFLSSYGLGDFLFGFGFLFIALERRRRKQFLNF